MFNWLNSLLKLIGVLPKHQNTSCLRLLFELYSGADPGISERGVVHYFVNNFVKNNFILLFLGRIKQNGKKKMLLKGGGGGRLQPPQPLPWIRL